MRDGFAVLPKVQLFADVRPTRTLDCQPRRLGRPIDSALGKQHLVVGFKEAKLETAGAGIADENFHSTNVGARLSSGAAGSSDPAGWACRDAVKNTVRGLRVGVAAPEDGRAPLSPHLAVKK